MTQPEAADNLINFTIEGRTLFGVVETSSLMSVEAPVVGDVILDEMQRSGDSINTIVVDLSRVNFINSLALGMLVTVQTTVIQHGLEFCLLGVDPTVQKVLSSTRLDSVFRIFDTHDELKEALDAKPT